MPGARAGMSRAMRGERKPNESPRETREISDFLFEKSDRSIAQRLLKRQRSSAVRAWLSFSPPFSTFFFFGSPITRSLLCALSDATFFLVDSLTRSSERTRPYRANANQRHRGSQLPFELRGKTIP